MKETSPNAICPGTQPFVRDQWYVIAFSHEVEQYAGCSRENAWMTRYCCSATATVVQPHCTIVARIVALRFHRAGCWKTL